MSIDYIGKLTTIVDIFKSNNTTTSSTDLSASMTTRIPQTSILLDDPNIRGLRSDFYPALFVSLDAATEEEVQLGASFTNRKKEKTINYDIHGLYKKEGHSVTHEATLKDFYQMSENVENVLKANASLSGTALHMELVNTEFKTEQSDQTWIKVFKIDLQVRYFFT